MPRTRALTDADIITYGGGAKHFRGVFMRDTLPDKPRIHECGIVNLDRNTGSGTHWVAYRKIREKIIYYDSFGNLPPPRELLHYFKNYELYYNFSSFQSYNTTYCGQLCIQFLFLENPSDLVLKRYINNDT